VLDDDVLENRSGGTQRTPLAADDRAGLLAHIEDTHEVLVWHAQGKLRAAEFLLPALTAGILRWEGGEEGEREGGSSFSGTEQFHLVSFVSFSAHQESRRRRPWGSFPLLSRH
jgi:hypothetical protein